MNEKEKNKKKEFDELDEMFKNASNYKDSKSNRVKEEQDNSKKVKKVVLSTLAGAAILTGAFFSVGYFTNYDSQTIQEHKKTGSISETKKQEETVVEDNWDFDFPIGLKSWAKTPYDEKTFWNEDNMKLVMNEARKHSSLVSGVSWIKSGLNPKKGAKVYTNDVEKRYLKNGEKNPLFYYALAEDYKKAYVTYTERLLNPVFGNWSASQSKNMGGYSPVQSTEFEKLEDMFTDDWWAKNIKESEDYSKLPVLAEWKQGSWKNLKLKKKEDSREGVFYGRVENDIKNFSKVSFVGNDSEGMPIIKIISPVKFYANKEGGGVVKKSGTLTLTLQSNPNSIDVKNRVVISNASLKMN